MNELSNYRSKILDYFTYRVGDDQNAEDLVQEVFIRFARNLDQLEKIRDINAWLFSVSRNVLIDYYRKNNRTVSLDTEDLELDIEKDENQELYEEMLQCQEVFLGRLDTETQYLIKKADIEGVNQKILAEELGKAYPTVRSKIQRGRAQIKKMFTDMCNVEFDAAGKISGCSVKKPCESTC